MPHRSVFCALLSALLLQSAATPSTATTRRDVSLSELTLPAQLIVRGRCLSATAGSVRLAGAEFAITTYAFRVTEYLKGTGSDEIVFRQVGTRDPRPRDLGRLAGLPVYTPGSEYVLFLLPESQAGLTSPSGAGDGALSVEGEQLLPLRSFINGLPGVSIIGGAPTSISYHALRQGVIELSGR